MTEALFTTFWPIMRDIVATQETYAFDPTMDAAEARRVWWDQPQRTLAAVDGEQQQEALGSYYIKPNAAGPGDHVCNCGYMVAPAARGRGLASAMCEHSQALARSLGYRAMQFNAVVSTNEGAVRLWQRHGFEIIGTLPEGFRHKTLGYVDSFIMHKRL